MFARYGLKGLDRTSLCRRGCLVFALRVTSHACDRATGHDGHPVSLALDEKIVRKQARLRET
jgi:hypothetical protein